MANLGYASPDGVTWHDAKGHLEALRKRLRELYDTGVGKIEMIDLLYVPKPREDGTVPTPPAYAVIPSLITDDGGWITDSVGNPWCTSEAWGYWPQPRTVPEGSQA